MPFRVSGVIHIIGYILMMQMFSSISDFDSDSRAHFRSETFQRFIYFIIFNTLSLWREIVSDIRVSGVIHIIGYILMMQMFFFNFRF